MNYLRSLINVSLSALGGILGNLIAAAIQQDAWGNLFTPARLLATAAGFLLVILLLARLDATARRRQPPAPPPPGVSRIVQIGSPLIRVLRGVNVYGVWQIGGGRIEVIDGRRSQSQENDE